MKSVGAAELDCPRPILMVARRRVRALLTLATALAVTMLAAPAHAGDLEAPGTSDRPTLSYRETGCTEIGYARGGLASAVRPLVPPRFTLVDFPGVPEGSPSRVQLYVNEVTCNRGSFNHSVRGGRYTYLIVSAFVTATEGDQRDGSYILFYATENPTQQAALRRLGWPVTALSTRTTAQITRDTAGTPVASALHVVGGGWNHDIAAVTTSALSSVETSTYGFYRDTVKGPSTLCFANRAGVAAAVYSGDLRGTPFATVAYVPPIFTGYPGNLVVGEWDVTVTNGPCSAPAAALRQYESNAPQWGISIPRNNGQYGTRNPWRIDDNS